MTLNARRYSGRVWWKVAIEKKSIPSIRDPLRLIYSKGMMRHRAMLNAAFMTRC